VGDLRSPPLACNLWTKPVRGVCYTSRTPVTCKICSTVDNGHTRLVNIVKISYQLGHMPIQSLTGHDSRLESSPAIGHSWMRPSFLAKKTQVYSD
jgi:hypothetical protein